ncbi:hypothetical protein RZR97_04500 [Hydrogenimonas thermophila]|uniref:hypothetical protein n=1 Tax=Hydrogenimonas thermophila TaxID=223786 RepID=UPI002936F420|nr:hypothetical protein [Hydrogenimonas thermophila]WOE70835.1 hypothetical protein RZR91_04520 [Hydrogenimonas thermophila]WOE73353.1 hypothetical protein RZR97_04500 [Hydrogenimonas thermophila]
MKKVAVVIGLITLIVVIFLSLADKPHPKIVLLGNSSHQPVDFLPKAYQCSACKMPIESKKYSAEVVAPDGKTWFFDDVGCLGEWIAEQKFKDNAVIWVYTIDTKRWIDGRKAWYSVFENTPMGYGFGAYEKRDNNMIDFKTMVERMVKGENLTNREYAKKLLEMKNGSR